jgi:hypothetical protein
VSCLVFTEARWKQLLEGRLAREEKAQLRAHLASDCAACDHIFETMDEAMEARIRILLRAREEHRRPAAQGHATRPQRWLADWFPLGWFSRSAAVAWGGGIAVAVLIVGALLSVEHSNAPRPIEKGEQNTPWGMELQFAIGVVQPDGRLSINRGTRGARYRPDDRLYVQVHLAREGYLYLVHVGPAGEATLLEPGPGIPPLRHAAGVVEIPADRSVHGLPLADWRGRHILAAVVSVAPLSGEEQVRSLVRTAVDLPTGEVNQAALEPYAGRLAVEAVSFDVGA